MSNTEIVLFFLFLSLIVAEFVQDEIFLNTPITKTGESANYHFTLQFPLSSYTLLTITTTPNDPANPAYIYVSQTESSTSKETATYSSEKEGTNKLEIRTKNLSENKPIYIGIQCINSGGFSILAADSNVNVIKIMHNNPNFVFFIAI